MKSLFISGVISFILMMLLSSVTTEAQNVVHSRLFAISEKVSVNNTFSRPDNQGGNKYVINPYINVNESALNSSLSNRGEYLTIPKRVYKRPMRREM